MINIHRHDNEIQVCNYNEDFVLYQVKRARKFKFIIRWFKSGSVVARFDTEEKGRMYCDALSKGIEHGFRLGYKFAESRQAILCQNTKS